MTGLRLELQHIRTIGPGGAPVSVPGVAKAEVLRSLFRTLRETPLCSLATVAPRGTAHSCHVYFAYSKDLELFFLSDPDSRHCQHVRESPSMAVSVYDSRQRWGGEDRGVALYGTCREAHGRGRVLADGIYGRRFKPYARWRAGLDQDDEPMKWRFYRFVASRVKVFDEARLGPGVFVEATIRREPRSE